MVYIVYPNIAVVGCNVIFQQNIHNRNTLLAGNEIHTTVCQSVTILCRLFHHNNIIDSSPGGIIYSSRPTMSAYRVIEAEIEEVLQGRMIRE